MKPDFSGYAMRSGVRCKDGRIISKNAFKQCDGKRVPIAWQHYNDDPSKVLGYGVLKHTDKGLYMDGYFNATEQGKIAKELVRHGDINCLSINANHVTQNGDDVLHGDVVEVSLVYSGANPGAFIENVSITHGDFTETLDDELIIYSGDIFKHNDDDGEFQHEDDNEDESIADILATLNEKQATAVKGLIGMALSDDEDDDEFEQSDEHEGDENMKFNAFDQSGKDDTKSFKLSDEQISAIFDDAINNTKSLKASVFSHAATYGIENIEILFPDARSTSPTPEFIKRDMDWVSRVINGARHTPFSRLKTVLADITADEARAKGYVKGNRKKEEVIKVMKRVTTPTTIYKKQKLDRDDIIDITDLNVVAWIKGEMRIMLNEEIARAILVSDGRQADSEDKVNEDNIRPIIHEDELYCDKVILTDADNSGLIEAVLRARKSYKGSGSPTFFTTEDVITDLILEKDLNKRRIYGTEAEVAAAMRVSSLVPVPVMEGVTTSVDGTDYQVVAVLVNMSDYTIGADKGGQVNMFDDFDIDYNQYKYLMETRISGALTKYKSAQVFLRPVAASGRRSMNPDRNNA